MADKVDTRVPVTVLTGFLGSGKTTLLNYILKVQTGLKIAVIENEFGEVGVDDALVRKKYDSEEEIFEMNNGCICCTRKTKLDALIIETTGLADPAPVAQTFFMDEEIKSKARLDGVLTVVDYEIKPEGVENEAVEQVAFADRLLVNKTDLVDEKTLAEYSQVDLKELMGLGGFNLKRVLEFEPDFLDDDVSSVGIREPGELDMDKLNAWLGKLLKEDGANIYRIISIFFTLHERSEKFVFQGVHMLFDGEPMVGEEWQEGETKTNKFIFIGKNLKEDELLASFRACIAK
eukprot:GSMAST32.ASY1.ANO1.357.1 assembled CDS